MDPNILDVVAYTVANVFDSDSEDEDNCIVSTLQYKSKKARLCIQNYEEVITTYNLEDFKSHFRLKRTTFENLVEVLGTYISKHNVAPGRPSHDVVKQLLIVIWMLANQESYRSVSDRFDVAKATAWEYVHKVAGILRTLANQFIKWPTGHQALKTINNFKERQHFPGVIGAIDGTHIPIVAPNVMPHSYVNRNKYHSILLQGVCNSHYIFTDCFAGVPGSVHEARLLRMSELGRVVETGHLFPSHSHLLGDSAYPNKSYLLTPYKDNGRLTQKQKKYNFKHSSTRVYIEQTFGMLKARFRILKYVNVYRTDLIPNIIIACCVLHNICMEMEDEYEIEMDERLEIQEEVINDAANDVNGTNK